MSFAWAARIPQESSASVSRLRLVEGISLLESDEALWLRGESLDEPLDRMVRSLPGALRYRVLDDGQLILDGRDVPTARMPEGRWQPLRSWATVELPSAAFAGQSTARIPIELVRSDEVREPAILLTTLDEWRRYGLEAPQIRLDRWTFAVSTEGRALIRGTPLPPIPGERFVETEGIAISAGWSWTPAIDAATLRDVLSIDPRDVALIHSDGSWEVIGFASFVRATRSAIRASSGSLDPSS